MTVTPSVSSSVFSPPSKETAMASSSSEASSVAVASAPPSSDALSSAQLPSLTTSNFPDMNTQEREVMSRLKACLGENVDEEKADKAIQGSRFGNAHNVDGWTEAALNYYFDSATSPITTVATCANRPANAAVVSSTQTATDIVDLTKEDDMQKALHASIAEQHNRNNVSKEELDMSKAIEESLKANTGSYQSLADPPDPHSRTRQGITPVGLKNVGNTCWFNAIVQALFNIPMFRRVLLDYPSGHGDQSMSTAVKDEATPMEEGSDMQDAALPSSVLVEPRLAAEAESATAVTPPDEPLESDQIRLTKSLRRLFGLLVGSKRKYVDPSEALNLIAKLNIELNFAPSQGIQQDVTEMLLRLIEWLEQALGSADDRAMICAPSVEEPKLVMDASGDAGRAPASPLPAAQSAVPPASALGDSVPSPPSSLSSSPAITTDGQPLKQIFHGSHIEERTGADGRVSTSTVDHAIHLTNLQVDVENNLHDSLAVSQWQESSNDNLGCEQWFIHVPPVLVFSLRRFSFNKSDNRTVKLHGEFRFPVQFFIDRYLHRNREVVTEKRQQVKEWRRRLNEILSRIQGYDSYPVKDGVHVSLTDALRAMLRYYGAAEEIKSPIADVGGDEPMDTSAPSSNEVDIVALPSAPQELPLPVFDRHGVSTAEQTLLDRLLKSGLAQAVDQLNELRRQAAELRLRIETTYDETNLQQDEYRLHAVLIHEGEANVGHYWAYIADHSTLTPCGTPVAWRKYNDKTVEPTTWEQVAADSFGTRRSCSAYCLIYVHKRRAELFENDVFASCSTVDEAIQLLPRDLSDAVDQDNAQLLAETADWDEKVKEKMQWNPASRPSSAAAVQEPELPSLLSVLSDASTHSKLAFKHLGSEILAQMTVGKQEVSRQELLNAIECVLSRVDELTKKGGLDGQVDPRFMHIIIWLNKIGKQIDEDVKRLLALESLQCDTAISKHSDELQHMIGERKSLFGFNHKEYEYAHAYYSKFLRTAVLNKTLLEDYQTLDDRGDEGMIKLIRVVICIINTNEELSQYCTWDEESLKIVPLCSLNLLRLLLLRLCYLYAFYVKTDPKMFGTKQTNIMRQLVQPILVRFGQTKDKVDEHVLKMVHSIWQEAVGAVPQHGDVETPLETLQMILDASERKSATPLPSQKANVGVRPNVVAKETRAFIMMADGLGLLDPHEDKQFELVDREASRLQQVFAIRN